MSPSSADAIIAQERSQMLEAARRRGLKTLSIAGHPPLQGDIIRIGRRRAEKALVLCSGAPGPGGLLPLRIYRHMIASDLQPHKDIEILVISAVNPHGPPWPTIHTGPHQAGLRLWDDDLLREAEWLFQGRQTPEPDTHQHSGWSIDALHEIARSLLSRTKIAVSLDLRDSLCRDFRVSVVSCDPANSYGRHLANAWMRQIESHDLSERYAGWGQTPAVGPVPLLQQTHCVNLRIEFGHFALHRLFAAMSADPTVTRYPGLDQLEDDWWRTVEPHACELIATLGERLAELHA